MKTALLAAWLCGQAWTWPTMPNATGYRIYWANDPAGPWCMENVVEIPSAACDASSCEWDPPMDHADLYFQLVAWNARGESPWPVAVPRVTCVEEALRK